MTDQENIIRVRLLVDVYYEDPHNLIEQGKDDLSETVLNIVDYADEEGLLHPDYNIKLVSWHSVVSEPTTDFIDDLPNIEQP